MSKNINKTKVLKKSNSDDSDDYDSDNLNIQKSDFDIIVKSTKSSNSTKSTNPTTVKKDLDLVERKKKVTKDELYKSDQDQLFQKVKDLIKLSPNNTFLSKTVAEHNEKITKEVLADIKKYFHSSIWCNMRVESCSTQSSLVVLKKIFSQYNYNIISHECKKNGQSYVKYYVVPKEEDDI